MIVAELAALLGLEIDESKWDKGHELVESLHHAVEAFVGVEAVAKLKEMVSSTVENAVQAKHLGEQLGISTDAVQELGYAADVTGVGAENMTGAMRHLARGMQELRTKGTGPAAEAFQRLGIHMSDLKGETLDQNLEVIATHFAKMPDGAQKAALALQLFGREGGARLVPLLNKGQAGIVELRNEAEKLGVVIGKEGVEKAEEFELSQKRLGATLVGLKNQAVMALLPGLQEMVEALSAWVSENREAIASTLEDVVHGIGEGFHMLGAAVSFVTKLVQDHQEVFQAALVAIGVTLAAFAVEAAIDWAIAFLPVTAFVAVLAAVALGVKKLGEYITGESMTWGELWDAIVQGGEDALAWIEDLPNKVDQWMTDVANSIKQAFTDAFDWAVQKAKDAWHEIEDTPVIGHIIRGAEFLGGKLGVGDPVGDVMAQAQLMAQQGVGQAPLSVPTAANISYAFGDTHVTIAADGVKADELDTLIGGKIAEHHKDMIREAYNAQGGGRRAGQ